MRQAKAHLGRHVPYGDLLVVVSLRWADDPEPPRTRCTKCGVLPVDRADLLLALANGKRNITVG